ncbi:DUF2946 family protein (plasmid) [Ralstonia syzygii subsp. celebesensis]|nr:DUF2946 family protein [Ralstonia syzygii]CCA86638.1 conserved exported hypothetical protein [Ralstonia syzygii R24]
MTTAKRMHRQIVAWVAIFAMLCHALMPAIAQAKAGAASPLLVQLCSVSGVKVVAIDAGKSTSSPEKPFNGQRCHYCLSGSHFALPPASGSAPVIAGLPKAVFVPAVSTPRLKSRKLAAAPPRGPPSLS